jgi:hypothetical protein
MEIKLMIKNKINLLKVIFPKKPLKNINTYLINFRPKPIAQP